MRQSGRYGPFDDTVLKGFPVPVPEDYILGIDSRNWTRKAASIGFRVAGWSSVGPGNVQSRSLPTKLPLGSNILFLGGAVYWIVRSRRFRLLECPFMIPALGLLTLLSTQTGSDWAFRYLLPVLL